MQSVAKSIIFSDMRELLRTNDTVLLSYVAALLSEAAIGFAVLDQHTSLNLGGDMDLFRRRVMVAEEQYAEAARTLREAGLGHELTR